MDLADVPHLLPPPPAEEPAFNDPAFVRASTWLARAARPAGAVVVGAPYGGGSISRARCDLAPAAIRSELARFSVWSSDHAVSLERLACLDAGDVEPGDGVIATQERIAGAVRALADGLGAPIVVLGGDNSITAGAARGAGADALITLDAHHDCRDPAVAPTNGSVVRQLVEGGLASVVQIGIHGFANAEEHARWAQDHKIHQITAHRVREEGTARAIEGALRLTGAARRIWVDVDLDVLSRAFAPGASASMPGGLEPHHLEHAAFLLGKDRRVAGLDITELDPTADVAAITTRAACAVLLHFLAGVASR